MPSNVSALLVRVLGAAALTLSSTSYAVETPVEECSGSHVRADATQKVFSGAANQPLFVQDETSSQAAMSTPAEADWLHYVEMHEQLSGSSARSVFMPWFSLQHEAN